MSYKTKINYALPDWQIDQFFEQLEKQDDVLPELLPEQIKYEPTPYNYILNFLNVFKPRKKDIIYDLGSGFGRVVILGALNCDSKFKGIEIIEERVDIANEIKKQFDLKNAEFYCGNVLDFDISDGDIFFLFNPFSDATLKKVGTRLHEISKIKPIKIATWGGSSNEYFRNQKWLKKIDQNFDDTKLEYFVSV